MEKIVSGPAANFKQVSSSLSGRFGISLVSLLPGPKKGCLQIFVGKSVKREKFCIFSNLRVAQLRMIK
jgi:hypothetical protein